MAKNVVVSLSGGMDSSTLLLRCLSEYDNVTALSFDYGQKHRVELLKAQSLINYLNDNGHKVKYQVIKLDGLVNLLNSNLVEGGDDVPEGHYEEDNMKATVVPNRNKIFASLVQAVALSEANTNGNDTDIALGIHAGDHAIYPDCRPEFYDILEKAFAIGNWNSEKVSLYLPYIKGNKETILRDSIKSCSKLGLDFNTVFANTNTSYNPDVNGRSSGTSGADIERILAFYSIGKKDPIEYIKPWEEVLSEALKIQLKYHVMKESGTERPFTGEYDKHFKKGIYTCSDCGKKLFSSKSKFDSGCGWPAFSEEVNEADIIQINDSSYGMTRIEVRCSGCESHLGHLFHESRGPRYCINSICLDFKGE